jgi:hypothetical protein
MPKIRRHKLPEPLLVHLLTRMRERNISHEQIILFARWLVMLKRRERRAPATRIVLQSFRHAWSLEKIREMKSVLPSSFLSPPAA